MTRPWSQCHFFKLHIVSRLSLVLLLYWIIPVHCLIKLQVEDLCHSEREVSITLQEGPRSAVVLTLNQHKASRNYTKADSYDEIGDDSSEEDALLLNSTSSLSPSEASVPKQDDNMDCMVKFTAPRHSGMLLIVEEVHLERGKTCKEYIEIIGKTTKGKNRSSKLCGDHRSTRSCAAFSRDTIYEDQFTEDLNIRIRALIGGKTSLKNDAPRVQLVVTAFTKVEAGSRCNASSQFSCPSEKARLRGYNLPESDDSSSPWLWAGAKLGFGGYSLSSGPQASSGGYCIWSGLTCDGHKNCPSDCSDETRAQCPKQTKPIKENSKAIPPFGASEVADGAFMSKVFMGLLVVLVALLSIMSCQWACRRKNIERPPPSVSGDVENALQGIHSISTMVTTLSSVSQSSLAPPPSYADVEFELGPPPDYNSVILFLTPKSLSEDTLAESEISQQIPEDHPQGHEYVEQQQIASNDEDSSAILETRDGESSTASQTSDDREEVTSRNNEEENETNL